MQGNFSKRTVEQKAHLSRLNLGVLHPKWGKKDSEETRAKKRDSMKRAWREGKCHRSPLFTGANLKGRAFSEEHKAKISTALKGKKKRHLTLQEKMNISLGLTKEKIFKGFKIEESRRVRKSDEYIYWRNMVFRLQNYTCQACGQKGGKLQVDHRYPFSLFPEHRTRLANGRVLCLDCHKKTPTYMGRMKKFKTRDDFRKFVYENNY